MGAHDESRAATRLGNGNWAVADHFENAVVALTMEHMSTLPAKGFLTVGIDTSIRWPAEAQVIRFRGRELHLLPGSEELACMIRVETATGFTQADANKLILEFLSALAWAKQRGAVATFGSWCTSPLNIGKGPGGVIGILGDGHFDFLPDPPDPKAKLALALYREGMSVNLKSFQFLGFFKVINVIRDKGADQKQWISDNLQHVTDTGALKRIAAIQTTHGDVATYLYGSGRCAVAHAFDPNTVMNPDDPADLIRLSADLPVIRELARIAIERELGVKSERDFHSEHLYELEGFRARLGDSLVVQIKAEEQVPSENVPIPKTLSVRLRDRDRIELFESMDAAVVYVRDGCVRIRLGSACRRLVAFVTLDFARESLVSDPLTDIHFQDDGTPDAAKMMLQWALLHRWWFGSNGTIELWDAATGTLLARAQPYMPPVNSRFPYHEFEKMESELRARAGIPDPPKNARC